MDVTPKLLRDVEFREQRRGYDQKEVDDFLERVAVAFGQLRDQLDEALERATRAERRVLEAPADEDELRRTLVLASRTAEAAESEARERAAATVEDAEARAAATLRQAEDQAAAVVDEAEARVRDDLEPLLVRRADLERDVETLEGWSVEARRRLADDLRSQLAWLEGDGPELPPRPAQHATDVAVPSASGPDGSDAGGPYGDADGWDPTPPDVRVGTAPPDGDATATFDTLGAADDGDGASAATAPVHGEGLVAPAEGSGADDDPFLAELRRAVDDDEPLGPRDGGTAVPPGAAPGSTAPEGDGETEASTSWFRRQH